MKKIDGEEMSCEKAILKNKGLIIKMVENYKQQGYIAGMDYDDLVSMGYIGLIRAYQGYDDSLGYKFSTYAYTMLRSEITRGIEKSNPGVFYPAHIKRFAQKIMREGWADLPIKDIAVKLKTTNAQAQEAFNYAKRKSITSLNAKMKGEKEADDNKELLDILGEKIDYSHLYVQDFLDRLTKNEAQITICLLQGMTYRKIGDLFGCSRTTIANRIKKIKEKYNEYFTE